MPKRKTLYIAFVLMICTILVIGCGVARQSAAIGQGGDLGREKASNAQYPAVITQIQGKVDIKRASSNLFVPANTGDALQVNTQVRTGDDGYARIHLSTGTIIRVSPDSLYTLESNQQKDSGLYTRLTLSLGRVFIVLNGGSLDVSTGLGVASVRGSYIMTMLDPSSGNVIVTCLEGDCGAENPEGEVHFTNGQKVILYAVGPDGKYEKIKIGAMDLNDFNLWIGDVPEAYDMVVLIAKEVGIGIGNLENGTGPAANCDQSKALGCDDHPGGGNDKGKGGNGDNGKGGGKP